MNEKELKRMKILLKLTERKLSQKKASEILDLSTRQVRRLVKKYQQKGLKGIVSKKRGMKSNNKTSDIQKSKVIEIIENNYKDFGPTLASEKLRERDGIIYSKETIRNWMIEHDFWKAKRKRDKKAHPQRERRSSFGELIQIDGSPHAWFEDRGPYCNLTVFIDDATGEYMEMFFTLRETTKAYAETLLLYLKDYGKPGTLYSDKHQIFKVNNKKTDEESLSQFGRMAKDLDIKLITANSPQAKGRVERANLTLQDRLVKELRLRNINTMEEANKFLKDEYKYTLTDKFSVVPKSNEPAHRKVTESKEELERIFSIQEERKITKDLEISYYNTIYQIKPESSTLAMKHQKVMVCTKLNGEVELIYKKKSLQYTILRKQEKQVKTVGSKNLNSELDKTKREFQYAVDE